jgi:biopolymer transport protein ExbD
MALVTRKEEPLDLNLTPMIDVLFLLIIFFMVGAKFTDEARDIDLRLPTVAHSDAIQSLPTTRSVEVYRDGSIRVDGQLATLAELTSNLQAATQVDPGISVAVLGDAGVAFQHVAGVMAACKTAGIRDLAVSVQIQTE